MKRIILILFLLVVLLVFLPAVAPNVAGWGWIQPSTTIGDPTNLNDNQYSPGSNAVKKTAGTAITASKVYYMGTDGKLESADASGNNTISTDYWLSTAPVSENESGIFLIPGTYYCDTDWSFTAGDELWLSITTGNITSTKPSSSNEIVQHIGQAIESDTIFFNPDPTYLQLD